MRECSLFAGLACMVALSACAAEGSMPVEADGVTNKTMKSEAWRTNRDYQRRVSDFRRKRGATLLDGTFKADEGFSVNGGRKIVANRWDGENGETGILVWNADDKPAKVSVEFGGRFILASELERGEVDPEEPIPANTLRLYEYRYVPPQPQDAARVDVIRKMLRPEAGFPETRIDNREFWGKVAATRKATGHLESARKIADSPTPVPDDARYAEYGVWSGPLSKCNHNLSSLALAECLENKGSFLPKIVECLEVLSTRRCWTGRYHDRNCLAFKGKIHIVELGSGMISQNMAVVLDVLRERLPSDVRARALMAMRRHCLDTYLAIARDPSVNTVARANKCGWLGGYGNWNAACNEYMVSAALHVLDDPTERAEAIELAERSTKSFLAGYTEEGLCLEGSSYWTYGFGQYLRLALWTRRATGSFLSFVTPFAKKAYLSSYGNRYSDVGGPSYGDCSTGISLKTQHLGALVWPEFDVIGSGGAGYLSVGLADFTLRCDEFRDPKSFLAKKQKPFAYPLRSWYPDEIGQLMCRPHAEDAGKSSLYAAIHGGHNGRPHGHHDIGSYCIAVGGREVMGDPGNCRYGLDTFGPKRFENPMRNSFGHPVPKVDGHLQSNGVMSRAKVAQAAFSDERDFVEYDMKGAYREAANLTALTRSLEYWRTEGRVVVTDKVTFNGKGRFETALTTFGKVEDIGGGSYRFSGLDGKVSAECKVYVKGAGWHLEKEVLPEKAGTHFAAKPLRAAIVLDDPVREAEVKVTWEVARR